jgi:Uma2 family endonuclease
VLLIVEVSSSTAPFDRDVKLPLYAGAGIGQVWLVDLDAGVVEVYRGAAGGSYGGPEVARGSDEIAIDAFPGLRLTAAEILGRGWLWPA